MYHAKKNGFAHHSPHSSILCLPIKYVRKYGILCCIWQKKWEIALLITTNIIPHQTPHASHASTEQRTQKHGQKCVRIATNGSSTDPSNAKTCLKVLYKLKMCYWLYCLVKYALNDNSAKFTIFNWYLSTKVFTKTSQHTPWRNVLRYWGVLRYPISQQKKNYELISQHICYMTSSAANCCLSTKNLSTSEPLSSISAKKNCSVPSQHKWTPRLISQHKWTHINSIIRYRNTTKRSYKVYSRDTAELFQDWEQTVRLPL